MTSLLRPVTKMKCSMPASRASSTTCWISGPVDDGQHLLRHRLGGGKEARAEAGDRKHSLADCFHGTCSEIAEARGGSMTGCVNNRETLSGALWGGNNGLGFWSMPIVRHIVRALVPLAALTASRTGAGRPLSAIAAGHHGLGRRTERQMERGAGRVGPSADDAGRDPRRGRGLQELHRADVAGGGAARHFARELRERSPAPRGRPPDHGSTSTRSPSSPRRSGTISICSVSDARIAKRPRDAGGECRRCSTRWRRTYGVDRHYHRGDLGRRDRTTARVGGDRPVIRSTATLACVGRRQAYFRDEFLSALEILQRGDIRPEQLIGSWAGAFGPTQFMPTAFKRYAVDFDGDGRRDVVDSVPDLDRLDRQPSEEGRLGRGPDLGLRGRGAAGLQLHAGRSRRAAHAARMGAPRHRAAPAASRFRDPHDRAYLLVPAGARGPGFLMLR